MLPLCVDLDGSLILTDLLLESTVTLAIRRPLYTLALPGWLLQGKAYLKQRIAALTDIDPALLPYNIELLDWLRLQRSQGRKLILCTAADLKFATAIAAHLGIFDEVFASDGRTNLSASNKATLLVRRFGHKGFDYVGNSKDDIVVWAAAHRAIVIGNKNMAERAARVSVVEKHILIRNAELRTLASALGLRRSLPK
jgi:phosphoserine phosphatase